ncbi:MAG TPA: Fe2+-dependent dioxygenase [Steroidobacteraceae bacterium]|nr:Fe2+-dependent dioxygenase [Steroidobacteraceae bacterium]
MFLRIEQLLTAAEVQAIAELARQTKFLSGRASNPHNATKNNVIQDPADPTGQKASQLALAAIQRNEQARLFALPKRMAVPQLLKYGPGMNYGAHVDAAFMNVGAQPLRSDVSCTIFVSDPADYEGGELAISLGSETVRIRGKAGDAVFYPSTTLHEVAPISSGERLVLITFIESQIPAGEHRDLIYTLNEVRALEGLKMDWRNRMHLEYVIANLQRMWSR